MKSQLSDKSWFVIASALCFVLIFSSVCISFLANQGSNRRADSLLSTPSPSAESVVVEPMIYPLKWAVWNGSGVTGAAAKLANKLKIQGYEVIETGNAPVQTGTTIEITRELDPQKDEIINIVGIEKGTEPARMIPTGSQKYNVKVVIGK